MKGTEKKPDDTCLKGTNDQPVIGTETETVSSGAETSGEQSLPGASPMLCNLPLPHPGAKTEFNLIQWLFSEYVLTQTRHCLS